MNDEREYRVQCGFLLGRYPDIKIIALAPEQNRALLYWGSHRHSEQISREFGRWNSQRGASGTPSCWAGSNLGIICCVILSLSMCVRQEAAQQRLVNEDRATVRAGTVKTTTRGSARRQPASEVFLHCLGGRFILRKECCRLPLVCDRSFANSRYR